MSHLRRSALLLVLVLCARVAPAQVPAGPASGDVRSAFPAGDVFRSITEPLLLGTEEFAARIGEARARGSEPLGLVLAGGSARAYAHIGVLQELEAAGIRPDFIVANSMGAVIGMLYAAGISPDLLEEIVRSLPTENYLDFVLPLSGGLIDAGDFSALVRELVGDIDLKDTAIPIIVTAEDLESRRQVRIAAGDFATVLRTTFALPAIFEPVPLDGMLLVDGGTTNLVPVAIAAEYSRNLVVSTALYDVGMSFGNPFSVINRTFDIGKSRSGLIDLIDTDPYVIRNDVEHFSYMKFSDPDAIVEAGRKSARAAMPGLLEYLGDQAKRAEAVRDGAGAERIAALVSRYSRGAIPAREFDVKGAAFLRFLEPLGNGADDLPFERSLGAGANFALGRTRARIGALAGAGGEPRRAWAFEAGMEANPFDAARLAAAARLTGGFGPGWNTPFDPASLFGISALEGLAAFNWPLPLGEAILDPYVSARAGRDFDAGSSALLFRIGAGFSTPRLGAPVAGTQGLSRSQPVARASSSVAGEFSARLGAFYSIETAAGVPEHSFGPEYLLSVGGGVPGVAALRARVSGRTAIVGSNLEFTDSETFRASLPTASAGRTLVANLEFAWLADKLEFSMGELVLVKDIEVGPSLDVAWAFDGPAFLPGTLAPDALFAGLSLSLTASFAGLAPGDITLFAGVDASLSPVLGLRSSRVFPSR